MVKKSLWLLKSFMMIFFIVSTSNLHADKGMVENGIAYAESLRKMGLLHESIDAYNEIWVSEKGTSTGEKCLQAQGVIYFEELEDGYNSILVYSKLISYYSKSRFLDLYTMRLAESFENGEDYVNAAKQYEKIITLFPGSEYYKKAMESVERCFQHNMPDVAAVVNNKTITTGELEAQLKALPKVMQEKFESEKGKEQLLMQMVEKSLLVSYAEKDGIAQDGAVKKLIGDYREKILANEVILREIMPKIKVEENEIKDFYDSHVQDYTQKKKIRVFLATVSSMEEAQEIQKLVGQGKNFRDLAKERSTGWVKEMKGDLGYLMQGSRNDKIEQVAFTLDEGKFSEIFQTDDGYNIVWVPQIIEEQINDLISVKSAVMNRIKGEKKREEYKKFMDELKKEASVKILLGSSSVIQGQEEQKEIFPNLLDHE